MEFTPINSQEELDKVLGARLQRERETVSKQFQTQIDERDQKIAGFESQIADLNKKLEGYTEQAGKITELETKIKGYETSSAKMRIAHEIGLPYELAERLSGEDEKAMREDAEKLKKLMGARVVAPLGTTETDGANNDKVKSAWAKVSQALKEE